MGRKACPCTKEAYGQSKNLGFKKLPKTCMRVKLKGSINVEKIIRGGRNGID
jgi:hypothetical protein